LEDQQKKSFSINPAKDKPKRSRKLAAIMFTDMVGYSALTQTNESLALDLLEEHRRILRPLFPKHGGTEVETAGDAFFVEFNSALEAVNCAIEIQESLFKRNAKLEPEKHIILRIGLHVGDVVHLDSHVHGDGVNIAARLEPLSKPGGICLSEDVVRQIQNKIDLPLQNLPNAKLKNIKSAIGVYCVVLPWEEKLKLNNKPALSKLKKHQVFITLSVLLISIIVSLLTWNLIQIPTQKNNNRIAVLPLENISANSQDDYFAEGMTEELISQLAKISGLNVIARTSVLKYKNAELNIKEIGNELNVGTILEGSIRQVSDQARITVQLIDVETQEHLWTEDYNRKLNNIFAIQSEIALRIANELKIQLIPVEKQQLNKMGTENPEAYKSYLLGKFYLNKKNKDSIFKGLELFQEATKLDPGYALGYVGLADCYALIGAGAYGSLPIDSLVNKASEAINIALDLDETLAEAYNSLAYINFRLKWNWDAAEINFKKAIELKPGYAQAYERYAFYLALFKRFDEALPLMLHAEELDPLSASVSTGVGRIYHFSRQFEKAIEQYNKILEIDPDYTEAVFARGLSYMLSKRYDMAIRELNNAVKLSNGRNIIIASLGQAYAASGNKKAAINILHNFLDQQNSDPYAYFYAGMLNGALGNTDEAIEALYRAYEDHFGLVVYLNVSPLLDPLRSEPKYIALMKKIGLEK
jgi:TolB-like protein/class 3 adenylate cyclase/Flp pilus assembly protein TadD